MKTIILRCLLAIALLANGVAAHASDDTPDDDLFPDDVETNYVLLAMQFRQEVDRQVVCIASAENVLAEQSLTQNPQPEIVIWIKIPLRSESPLYAYMSLQP